MADRGFEKNVMDSSQQYRRPTRLELSRLRRSSRFDGGFYLRRYPDVAAARLDPFWHFVMAGAAEGRDPHRGFEAARDLANTATVTGDGLHPVLQYILAGKARPTPAPCGFPVRILLDTPRGVHFGENLGDVAMCAAALLRLRELSPDCLLSVVVDDPRVLAFTGVPFEAIPFGARQHWLANAGYAGGRRFGDALQSADVVATTGHGALVDFIVEDSIQMLRVLQAGQLRGARTAILGHGLGPFGDTSLRGAAAAVLPRVDLLCVREAVDAPALLASLGVPAERVVVTGDDAPRICVPPWGAPWPRPAAAGFGLSLRIGYGLAPERIPALADMARQAAAQAGLGVVPLPIDGGDVQTLTNLGWPCALAESPSEFMQAAARCRVVLAGSYHAAVLSLSQGVPTVVLSAGAFYRSKMAGLATWFATGCRVVDLDADPAGEGVPAALAWALARGPADCRGLVDAAREQIRRGDRALAELLACVRVAPVSPLQRLRQQAAFWLGRRRDG